MATHRFPLHHDVPRIPIQHTSWFIQMLMVLAVLILAGVVYGFWGIAQAPSPTLELPDAAKLPPPPTNEQAP
jgi:hypothetical protein